MSEGWATVRGNPSIVELAEKYGVTPAQVILAWHVARGVHAIPCSKNPEHQRENITVRIYTIFLPTQNDLCCSCPLLLSRTSSASRRSTETRGFPVRRTTRAWQPAGPSKSLGGRAKKAALDRLSTTISLTALQCSNPIRHVATH